MRNVTKKAMANTRMGGFTLLEVLITIAILAIIMAQAIPALGDFFDKKRLIAGAEAIYEQLQQARSEAIARSQNVIITFDRDGNTDWNVGMVAGTTACNPELSADATAANACFLAIDDGDGTYTPADDNVMMRIDAVDFKGANFISPTGVNSITFDYTRGTASDQTITMRSDAGKELQVVVGIIGRVKLCSPAGGNKVPGYPDC